jgi:hypothetical protein
MSRAPHLSAVWLALGAMTAEAQGVPEWRDTLQRLSEEYRAIRDSSVNADSTLIEVARRDGIVVSTIPRYRGAALQALDYFMTRRNRWFGTSQPSPSGFRIAIRVRSRSTLFTRATDTWNPNEGSIVLTGLPDSAGAVHSDKTAAASEVGEQLVAAYSEMMFPTLGDQMAKWLQHPLSFHLPDPTRRYHAMYAVMTSTTPGERGCVNGRIDFCAYALWLRPAPSAELTGAFPVVVRVDLFLTALELGGAGSWARVVEAKRAGPEAALAAASGLPADSVIAVWRRGIMALRPDERPLHLGRAIAAAGWTIVVLAAALGASRWH